MEDNEQKSNDECGLFERQYRQYSARNQYPCERQGILSNTSSSLERGRKLIAAQVVVIVVRKTNRCLSSYSLFDCREQNGKN